MNGRRVRGLGELEAVIMDHLWAADAPMSVREVRDAVSKQRSSAYTTVMTVMDNLHTKGWLTRERQGRAYIYRPSKTREVYGAELMREALESSGDRRAAFMHFVDGIPDEETAELRRALRRHQRRHRDD